MAPIDPGCFVFVTGGNGFIAAHCIATLLRSNYRVRATVRSFEKGEATRRSLSSAGVRNLSLLEVDIVPDPTNLNACTAILRGCQAILRLASASTTMQYLGNLKRSL